LQAKQNAHNAQKSTQPRLQLHQEIHLLEVLEQVQIVPLVTQLQTKLTKSY